MPKPWPVLLMVRELGIGGCERDLTKLAKRMDRSRFQPHVACFHSQGLRTAELEQAGVPIVHFPVTSYVRPSVIRGARLMGAYLKQHRIAIVHPFDVPSVMFAVPVARFYRTRVVIATQLAYRELVSKNERAVLRITDKLADVVVANSDAVRRDLVDHFGLPDERSYLCYNGVELEAFHAHRGPKLPPVADAALVIGTVCALRSEKRLDLLIRAFAVIYPAHPEARLLVVGSGPMLPELERLRNELNLHNACVFEPAKSEVADWMRSIDIFVNCSESESFPNALLEAMACGCAVIGSRVGGIPELIAEEQSGLLFEKNDHAGLARQLARLADHPALRERFAHAAAERARTTFSMDINVRRNQDLYESLLARKIGARA